MNGKPKPRKSELPYNSNLQERIFKAGNINYGRFRTAYKALREYYARHPEKLARLLAS